jgi:glycosyltransferase involved in cell wall biosynthesis
MVCASLGSACGIAAYTGSLCDAAALVPALKIESGESGTLLHVQHEDKLYDDASLCHSLSVERERGVVVAVTEHTASRIPRPWDPLVDVWISHTDAGYEWLIQRCPGSYVTRIAHGCPTWFPARERQPGRSIGTFGFVARSKGHAALMQALDSIPGADLVVYGLVKPASGLALFEYDYRNRAVRHVNAYLPESVVVQSLAQQTDVLVFWYDENLWTPGASGAVTVGLSTGVPVITSPTSRFAGLRSCTYQPPSLVDGIRTMLEDAELRRSLSARARLYCTQHSWPEVARMHHALWAQAIAAGQLV